MALTRAFLRGLELTDEQVSQIIQEHASTVDALKEQRDSYKAQAEKSETLESELKTLRESESSFEAQYRAEHEAYEKYRTDVETKAAKTAKSAKIEEALKGMSVSEKHIGSIKRILEADDSITIGENGEIADLEAFQNTVKEQYSSFISTTETKGADVSTPPANNNRTYSRADIASMDRDTINANWDNIKNSLRGE